MFGWAWALLTYLVLRLVHPVVVVLAVPVPGVEVAVRVQAVHGVQLALAVEDASALAGQRGHAQPAEGPGQARWLLLAKGRGPPVPSHPSSGSESKRGRRRGGSKCL